MSNKARDQKPTRPNALLEERLEAVRNGKGKLLKPKKAKPVAEPAQVVTEPEAAPAAETLPAAAPSRGYHPDAYGLRIADGSLGLHATPGAIVVVEPTVPAKAGIAVFYLKGQPIPAIFDLPRTFDPKTVRPYAPGSEVMPMVEAFAPETGALCRIRADQIEKVHRIIGVQTPVDSSTAWRPFPKRLPEMAQCPEGMGEHVVSDASMYPLIRPGETVVYDPSQRDPEKVAAFVLEWSSGARAVLETNFRQSGSTGEAYWWVDPVNRPVDDAAFERRIGRGTLNTMLFTSDGPYTEGHLRERIVGRVVGVLAPRERPRDDGSEPPMLALPAPAAEPQAVPLAQACDQAVRDWNAIQPTSRAEDWGDDQLDEALDAYDTVLQRAITEPSHDVADLQAKARLLLHDLLEHTIGHDPDDEAMLTVDEQLTRVVLREVGTLGALSGGTALASQPDPIFAAIQAHTVARAAFAETVNPQDTAWVREQGGDTSDEAMAPAHAAYEAASAAEAQTWAALFEVRPTTLPGVLALLRHCQAWAPSNDGQDGAPAMEDVFGFIADGLAAVTEEAEDDGALTVESAATLSFQAYTFDTPLRSPQQWADEFSTHAIPMHIADRTLRMTKPELMAFIRDAAERGDGTDEIMMKALNATSSTFDGWAKLLHLAGTRYLIAGASVAIEPETENGGA
ncbi:hypothetical protein ACRBEV_33300 (plasmid) [Methylobacterium phyllosphaerae]